MRLLKTEGELKNSKPKTYKTCRHRFIIQSTKAPDGERYQILDDIFLPHRRHQHHYCVPLIFSRSHLNVILNATHVPSTLYDRDRTTRPDRLHEIGRRVASNRALLLKH